MQLIKTHKALFPALAVMLLAAVSCEYKDLDSDMPYYRNTLQLDWDFSAIDSIPRSFRIAFYPADTETDSKLTQGYMLFDVYNGTAILSDLPAGTYNITAWNTDTEHNTIGSLGRRESLFAGMTTFYTSVANPSKVLDSLYYGQHIYDTPDYMVHANKERFTVMQDADKQPLVLAPDSMCVTIKYKVHGINGLSLTRQVRAAINNVTKTRLIAYGNETRDTCVVMTQSMINPKDSTISGSFYLYGMEPQDFQLMDHTMTLFFWLNQRNVYFPIKINTFLQPYTKDDKVIYLEIPDVELDLYKYLESMGSFEIDVNEWEDINIDIKW